MRISINQPAPDGTVYAPDAFARVIGEMIPITAPGYTSRAELLDAVVTDHGRAATFTVEIRDEMIAGHIRDGNMGMSYDAGRGFTATGWTPAEPA